MFLKYRIYANKPETIKALKDNIQREIAEIERQICRNIAENFTKRIVDVHSGDNVKISFSITKLSTLYYKFQ